MSEIALRRWAWDDVPVELRREVEGLCRSRIKHAVAAVGGVSPAAAFTLHLEDGQSVFFKGVFAGRSNEYMRRSIAREQLVYSQISSLLAPWAPRFVGKLRSQHWLVLILEDLGPSHVPPWTADLLRVVAHGFAEFHRRNVGKEHPAWLGEDWSRFASTWQESVVPTTTEMFESGLASDHPALLQWFVRNRDVLHACAGKLRHASGSHTILHLDVRSDNLRVIDGQLRLFDWSQICIGPPEFDVAAFAQSIAAEGGPAPDRFMSLYEQVLRLDRSTVLAALAGITGYFWGVAWRAPSADLPELRPAQRRQLRACLRWLADEHVIEACPIA